MNWSAYTLNFLFIPFQYCQLQRQLNSTKDELFREQMQVQTYFTFYGLQLHDMPKNNQKFPIF